MNVSTQTVRNGLKKTGLKSIVDVKKPLLPNRHVQQRLGFCKKYINWTVEDWKSIIWSDEYKINRVWADGCKYCWKIGNYKHQTELLSQHAQPTVKFWGGSLMIWGCMSMHRVVNLVRIDISLDAELYCKILEEVLPFIVGFYGDEFKNFIFQHHNDPKHTSKKVTKWLADNEIEDLEWPEQSTDLNPIEHLWGHLKRRLAAYDSAPTSIHALWERLEKEWNNIPS